jgi:hypothetical protein
MRTYLSVSKKFILLIVFFVTSAGVVFSQDSIPAQDEQKPLTKAPFESGICMDNQTVAIPPANTLEFVLEHRFGSIQGGIHDLYGLWAASNIMFGLNYSITKDLVVGFNTTKNKMYQTFQLKYTFLRQRDKGFPVTLSYFADMSINASNESNFGADYKFIDRLSYYQELMVARRFCRLFSLQGSFTFTHFNKVDSLLHNDNLGFSLLGRIKVSPQTSIVLSYEQSFVLGYSTPFILPYGQGNFFYSSETPLPNLGLGVEISTSTHTFHIFMTASQGIVPQEITMYNRNNFYNGQIVLGFNMTRLWTF